MPLVAHNNLPAFRRLRDSGQDVLSLDRARKQDIRALHIGFLNMMPDAALVATEQQFIRLVGASNQIAQFYVYPFVIPKQTRASAARAHIKEHYFEFEDLRERGLDALIVSGANPVQANLQEEEFWEPLLDVIEWASASVASVLCSCLATHALVRSIHGIERVRLPRKKWGVYRHQVSAADHPLVRQINSRFDAPHSRYNDVSKEQMEEAGLRVLIESDAAGVHLAVSPDQFQVVYFQGHPEYDAISLLKEYKREIVRYVNGVRDSEPPLPRNYFSDEAAAICSRFLTESRAAKAADEQLPEFPEAELQAMVDNTWGDTGKAIVNNWLGLVYQLTNLDRRKRFMEGVDPDDPLSLRNTQ